MAQEEKKTENKDINNIQIYLSLDGKTVTPTTHVLLKSWNASDAVLEAANLFIHYSKLLNVDSI